MKTVKSALKRFKITSTGKIRRRKVNLGHFNAKDSGDHTRRKRGLVGLAPQDIRNIKKILRNI